MIMLIIAASAANAIAAIATIAFKLLVQFLILSARVLADKLIFIHPCHKS